MGRSRFMLVGLFGAFCVGTSLFSQVTGEFTPVLTPTGGMSYALADGSTSTVESMSGSVRLEITPGGLVRVVDFTLAGPTTWSQSVVLQFPAQPVPASVTGLVVRHASPGTGTPIQGVLIGQQVSFSNVSAPARASGAAFHQGTGLSCAILEAAGAPCIGVFDLSALNGLMIRCSGTVPLSGQGPASIGLSGTFSLLPSAPSAVRLSAFANWSGTITASSCVGDFNRDSTITVQDIFDYLAAWFAGDARADLNSNGLSVQDIFDFLAAWFGGCP